jgi:hypothetical protein
MVEGIITTRHVLLRAPRIVHEFGVRKWLGCCRAMLSRRRTTFLELVWR